MSEPERPAAAGREAATTYNILFVCTGNTCRSPMAATIARDAIRRRGWHNVEVRSAGASADEGSPASPQAVDVAAERGLDLTRHRSQPLTVELVEWADTIVTMSGWHATRVGEMGGEDRVALASDFLAEAEAGGGVPDPIGMDTSVYRATWTVLAESVEALLDRLEAILAP